MKRERQKKKTLYSRNFGTDQLKSKGIQMAKVGSRFQVSDLRSAFQVIKLKPMMQHFNNQKEVLSYLKYLPI